MTIEPAKEKLNFVCSNCKNSVKSSPNEFQDFSKIECCDNPDYKIRILGNHGKYTLIRLGQYLTQKRDGAIKKNEKGEEVWRAFEKSEMDILSGEVIRLIAMKMRREATEEIVKYIEQHYKIYTTKHDTPNKDMYVHNGEILEPNGESKIREITRKILGNLYTGSLVTEVIEKIQADTFVDEEELFSQEKKDELAVNNGILNLITRELKPFSFDKIFFHKCPVDYDPSAECPKIIAFLEDVLAHPEDKQVFFEIVGRGLYKENFLEKAALLVGNGRNGKGKSIILIKNLVGIENCCSVSLSSMINESFFIAPLHQKLFNLAGDLGQTSLKDTGCFKEIVGRDMLQANRKFKTPLKFINHSQQIFAANELPIVYDKSEGFWTKWGAVLKFPYQFMTQKEINNLPESERDNKKLVDPSIIQKINSPEEMSGFLNECLDGLERLMKNNNFSNSPGSKEVKEFWIRTSDSFAAFCMDCLEGDPESMVTKKELRYRFNKYCKKHRIKGAGDKAIKARLEEEFGASEDRKTISFEMEHVWMGIKFKKDALLSGLSPFSDPISNLKLAIECKNPGNLGSKNSEEQGNFDKQEINRTFEPRKTKNFSDDSRSKSSHNIPIIDEFENDSMYFNPELQFRALEDISFEILKNNHLIELQLKAQKQYNIEELGDDATKILQRLVNDKKVKVLEERDNYPSLEESWQDWKDFGGYEPFYDTEMEESINRAEKMNNDLDKSQSEENLHGN